MNSSFLPAILLTAIFYPMTTMQAQGPPVTPPEFLTTDHSDDWEPGQLLFREVGLDRTTIVAYHNGVIYAGGFAGRPYNSFEWTDRSDASSFVRTSTDGVVNFGIGITQGTHGHQGKVGETLFPNLRRTSTPGVNVYEDNPDRLNFAEHRPPENADRFHDLYFPWRLPFAWPQYDNETGWGWGFRHTRSLGEWDATAETGVIGHTLMMGNLLFLCSDETFAGVAVYDLAPTFETPPQPPTLLDKLSGRIGGYLPAIWENFIIFPSDGELTLVDYSDPENLVLAGTFPVNRIPGQDYIQFQDNYGFYHGNKVNMETGNVELFLENYNDAARPAGSVSGNLNTSQYLLPVGNLLVTGGRGTSGEDGVGLWVHQDAPDTTRPQVGYHIPRPNQTNYPTGAAISLTIHETIEGFTAINGDTVILRKAGESAPVDCWVSFSHDDILTITPKVYLDESSEYIVEILDGGIKDVSGNGIIGHTFNFSTGSTIVGGNEPPVISDITVTDSPTTPGTPVQFTIAATDPQGTATLEYRFTAGDGSEPTDWSSGSNSFFHTYNAVGHFEAKLQVREAESPSAKTLQLITVTVSPALPDGPRPTKSSPITLDPIEGKIWVVNPDNNSVTRLDATSRAVELEVNLQNAPGLSSSVDPRSIAVSATGEIWIACRGADRIAVLDGSDGSLITSIDTGYGSAPVGVAASPDGTEVFVTTEGRGTVDPGNGQLTRYRASDHSESGAIELGPMPRAIAITGDGQRVLVTRFLSGHPRGGQVWDINATEESSLSLNGTIFLTTETTEDSESNGTGIPNYVGSITISPDENQAWYTATKPAVGRGELFGEPQEFANTMRAMVGRIDLTGPNPNDADQSRIDFDNADSPSAVAFSPRGDWVFVSSQGNQLVGIFDRLLIDRDEVETSRNTRARIPTGLAPQGILFDENTGTLWVKNLMSRSVTTHDLGNFLNSGSLSTSPTEISTVTSETLSPEILTGKQLFYDASGMSDEGYISCASCHIDGMHDGLTWDFTQRGEGLRNTTDLRGRGGMAHGNVHWTANFDEIQDFENDIRNHFGGPGFLSDTDFAASSDPLGSPRAGLDTDLDALAAYVTSLGTDTLPKSPYRTSDGSFTAPAVRGAEIFTAQNCAQCHDPARDFTDSVIGDGLASLHPVGTDRPGSGMRRGAALPGIDTPTLLGIWNTPPYFHNGSAESLADIFLVSGGTEYEAEAATILGTGDIRNLSQSNSVNGARGGEAVRFRDPGSGIEWVGIDGGSGGEARIELFYATDADDTLAVEINAVPIEGVQIHQTQTSRLDGAHWQKLILNVPLEAGTGNSIRVESNSNGIKWIDHLHVATADDFVAADAHTRIASIPGSDQADLISFLQQLDGSPGVTLTGPDAVSGLSLSNVTVNSVSLSWDPASGATSYAIFRSTDSDFNNAVEIGSTASSSFVDTGLAVGQSYTYWVESRNSVGSSLSDENIAASTISPQPDLVVGKKRTQTKGENRYNWSTAGQRIKLKTRGKRKTRAWLRLQNDGTGATAIDVKGTRSNRYFRLSYRRISSPAANLSAAIRNGSYTSSPLEGPASERYRVEIKPTSRAGKRKRKIRIRVGSVSTSLPGRRDRIEIRVERK